MPPNTARSDLVAESHEERIQRVESALPELTAEVATVSLQQRHLGEQLESLGDSITKQMHSLGKVMTDHATASQASLAKIDERILGLEKEQTKRQLILGWAKKAATPLTLAAAAAIGAFGEQIAAWLAGIFG